MFPLPPATSRLADYPIPVLPLPSHPSSPSPVTLFRVLPLWTIVSNRSCALVVSPDRPVYISLRHPSESCIVYSLRCFQRATIVLVPFPTIPTSPPSFHLLSPLPNVTTLSPPTSISGLSLLTSSVSRTHNGISILSPLCNLLFPGRGISSLVPVPSAPSIIYHLSSIISRLSSIPSPTSLPSPHVVVAPLFARLHRPAVYTLHIRTPRYSVRFACTNERT